MLFKFLNDAAYALANYDHHCTGLLGLVFSPSLTPTVSHPHVGGGVRACMTKIKSCSLNSQCCRLDEGFNSNTKELTYVLFETVGILSKLD